MIQFSWTTPASNGGVSIETYEIFWDNNSGSTDLTSYSFVGSKLASESLIFTKSSGLTPGLDFKFYVIAINDIGNSDYSDTITIMAASEPAAPSVFTTDSQSRTSITISWSEPDNGGIAITDYQIDWNQGDSVGSTYTSLVTTTSGTRTHTVSGLTTAGDVYRFKLRAINLIGASSDSAVYAVIAGT